MAKREITTKEEKLKAKPEKDAKILQALAASARSPGTSVRSFSSGRTLTDDDIPTVRIELQVPGSAAGVQGLGACDPVDDDNPGDATGDFMDLDPKGP